MSLENTIVGGVTGNKVEVSTNNALRTTGESSTLANDGAGNPQVSAYGPPAIYEADSGTVLGKPMQKQGDISANYRQRVGIDTVMFCDQFTGTALNTALWNQQVTTMAMGVAGGWLVLNNASSVATGGYARINSYRGFPIFGAYPLQLEIEALLTIVGGLSTVTELGFGLATANSAPSDGAFFRFGLDGTVKCVLNNNGTEVTSPALTGAGIPTANQRHHYIIVIGNDFVEFWIDNVLVYNYPVPAGQGMAISCPNSPVLVRTYNGGSAPTVATQVKVGQITVSCGDMNNNKGWSHVMAGMGGHCGQGQTGMTMGSTAQFPNSANPAAAVPTNTTAALGSGLGGIFLETDTLAVNTDGIISSYQVPALAPGVASKMLMITRVTITSVVSTALTGGGYGAVWSLAFGHTNVSLATAEGVGSKAPRRVPLGVHGVAAGAVAGTALSVLDFDLATPVPVQPGEFIQLVRRKVGTAPTAGAILHVISVGGYWE